MTLAKNPWNTFWGIALASLILLLPVLVGYDIYLQWHSPTMDFFTDHPGSSTVHSLVPGGQADAAGLEPGDVILTVDDIPFGQWYAPQIGRDHILTVERRGERFSLSVMGVRVFQLNYLSLASAIVVALAFWGIGALLFLRRFWNGEIRLLFLLAQTVAMTILFPLSYQAPWSPPAWILSFSVLGFNLVAPMFLHYVVTFPIKLGDGHWLRWSLLPVYGGGLFAFAAWLFDHRFGILVSIFYFSLVVAMAIAFMVYVYQFRATPDDRRRSRVTAFGTTLAGLPPVLFYLLPTAIGIPYALPEWAAGLFLILAPLSYLYATLRYSLFGIDRLINRTLVYAILSLGIFIVYLGPYLFLYRYLPDNFFAQLAFIFVLTLWIGWSFDWMRTRTQRLVDRLFYGGWYDYPVVVERISDALARSTTRDQIMDVLSQQIPELMKLRWSNLWIGDLKATFPSPPLMQARFRFKFRSEIPAQWTVGLHQDGDDLSDADQRILHTLAQQAEIALNNAFMIERLRQQLDEIRASREALAQTQHQLLRSREDERSRLARDLHDGPIQSLMGMNIQLGLLAGSQGFAEETVGALTEMRTEVRQLSSELRQVCAELRPPMLDTLGLGAAVRSLLKEWSEQCKIAISFEISPDAGFRSLPDEVAVNLYRVVQEALANIGKHARAKHVDLSLQYVGGQLSLTIQDDGVGFNTPDTMHSLTTQNHFGLAGMQERIELIGGKWSIQSGQDAGTRVSVTWQAGGSNHAG
jgi:signal transduction histidine kinase